MKSADRKPWNTTLSRLALLVALISALVPPMIYFGLKYEYEKAAIEFEAESIAKNVAEMINREPQFWRFHQYELDSITAKRRASHPQQHSFIIGKSEGVLSEKKGLLTTPIIQRNHPLFDSGEKVGNVMVARSIRSIVISTIFVALVSSLFGILVYFIVRTLPLRALRKAVSLLRDVNERAQITLHSIGDAVITTNSLTEVEHLNPVAERILSTQSGDAIGLPVSTILKIIDTRTRTAIVNPIHACLTGNQIVKMVEHAVLIRKDGQEFHIEYFASPIQGQDGAIIGAIVAFRDVTERVKAQEQLNYVVQYDALTGLPNRAQHQRRLEQALALSERNKQLVGLLFIDLDRFKIINDSLGHGTGDLLLSSIAQRLHDNVRTEDTVARLGGDEFAVILEGLHHIEGAAVVARTLLEIIGRPICLASQTLYISASIGIAVNEPGTTPEDLLQSAEIAMYRAKNQGRNNYQFFEASMNTAIDEHMQLESALRLAINHNEYLLHYQPKMDLASGTSVSVEALLRWKHPELGMVYPQKFIPILEETGMIVDVGEWVIREACRQAKAWLSDGVNLRIAVNISAKQLVAKNFDKTVSEILAEYELAGSSLEFEITESIFLSDIEQTESVLNSIESMGIAISLDDFGTGYSSLGYLKRFPISILKIDKTFINHIDSDREHRTLVEAMIVMAHALSMKVVAEGVETEEQRIALKQMSCNEIQGYLISRPLGAEALIEWVKMQSLMH